MLDFLSEYAQFLLQTVTVLLAVIVVIAFSVAQGAKGRMQNAQSGNICVESLNEKYTDYETQLKASVLSDSERKAEKKAVKQAKKNKKKSKGDQKANDDSDDGKPRLFVINFDGDIKASAVEKMRQEITAILTMATEKDEVVVRLESPGGMVHAYGLAASQLERIKDKGIRLVSVVDKVAASGGYLMACVADEIIAAPFAVIGSIGVLAQIPNFNRALKKWDVDYDVMTAGEHKAPVTMFGENSQAGKDKLQSDLENTHSLFKQYVHDRRAVVDINQVATGEVWYGRQALDLKLIDSLMTSDSYLFDRKNQFAMYFVNYQVKKTLSEKLGFGVKAGVTAAMDTLARNNLDSRLL